MTAAFVRLAGSGRRADGASVTWTIAEGRRGRRWRELVVLDGAVVHSLLYETGPDGRFSHLELSTASGMATLHPEGDGTLHGNVVRADGGVEHVVGMPFAEDAVLLVEGSPIASAAAALHAREDRATAVTLQPRTLGLVAGTVPVAVGGPHDGRGIPLLDHAQMWPLEVADHG